MQLHRWRPAVMVTLYMQALPMLATCQILRTHTFIMASLIMFSLMMAAVPKLGFAILVAVVFIGFTG